MILVCDSGGGTTDFTLIAVKERRAIWFCRGWRWASTSCWAATTWTLPWLTRWQARCPKGMDGLDAASESGSGTRAAAPRRHFSRNRKKNAATVTVLGRGSKVIGGSIKTELTREPLNNVLLDGFLPTCGPTDLPARGAAGRPDRDRPAVRGRRRDHAASRAVSGPAGRLAAYGRADCAALGGAVQRRCVQGGRAAAAGARRIVGLGRARRCPSSNRPTWTWPSPTAPRITARCGAARACGFAGACRGRTTSDWRRLRRRFPAFRRRSRPFASCRWAWRKEPRADVPGPEIGLIVGEPAEFRFLGSTIRRDDAVGTVLERWNGDELQELAHWRRPSKPRTAGRRAGARAAAFAT